MRFRRKQSAGLRQRALPRSPPQEGPAIQANMPCQNGLYAGSAVPYTEGVPGTEKSKNGSSGDALADWTMGKNTVITPPRWMRSLFKKTIMAALNTKMPPKLDVVTQITDALLQEAVPSRGSAMTLGEVKRRIEELTAEFDQLLELNACGNKADRRFAEIAKEMAELKRQQERIAAQLRNNQEAQERAHTIVAALDQEDHHLNEWDEEMIRQLVHTVKVISADHIRVYLNDGTEIDQTVSP